jgi:hypothetical protein
MALKSRLNAMAVSFVPSELSSQAPHVTSNLNSETSTSVLVDFPLGQVGRYSKGVNFRHDFVYMPRDPVLQVMQSTTNKMGTQDINVFEPNFGAGHR